MPKKLTYTYVKGYFKSFGYTLLSGEYINCATKLNFRCSAGHYDSVSIEKLRNGRACKYCNNILKLEKAYKKVKLSFDKVGCILLTKTYVNNVTKLDYICKNGHRHRICWNDFQQGYGCSICHKNSLVGSKNPNYKGGLTNLNIPLYSTYFKQLNIYHDVYKLKEKINNIEYEVLGVKCVTCGKVFMPKKSSIKTRICVIKGTRKGSGYFYCSNRCKQECSIFGVHEFPKGFKNYKNKRYAQTQWAKKVKERDDYICQTCGKQENIMFAHHKIPVSMCDMLSLDVSNGVTFCGKCHIEAHKKPGCTYSELMIVNKNNRRI